MKKTFFLLWVNIKKLFGSFLFWVNIKTFLDSCLFRLNIFLFHFLDLLSWLTLSKECPYSEFFRSVFFRIRTEYGEILFISMYSVQMWESADQKNYIYTLYMDTFHAVLCWVNQITPYYSSGTKTINLLTPGVHW